MYRLQTAHVVPLSLKAKDVFKDVNCSEFQMHTCKKEVYKVQNQAIKYVYLSFNFLC